MIATALSPAEGLQVTFDEEKNLATVLAPSDDQALLAIGRGGQNVRLAAKLLGISITIKSAGGQVSSQVTGKEEYEIDNFALSESVREILINAKLTNSSDILRFQNRLLDNQQLSEEDKQNILQKAQAQQQLDERNSLSSAIAPAESSR